MGNVQPKASQVSAWLKINNIILTIKLKYSLTNSWLALEINYYYYFFFFLLDIILTASPPDAVSFEIVYPCSCFPVLSPAQQDQMLGPTSTALAYPRMIL